MGIDFGIVVFISGRGSNLRALLEKADSYRVIGVISDNPDAPGLAFAKERGVAVESAARAQFSSRKEHKAALYQLARSFSPKLIALAGFMQIIEPVFVEEYAGRLINIHPSLLPAFPGLHTHERALSAKAKQHGCTVHFVDAGMDSGPIIAQARCECYPHDSVEALSERVLRLEHQLYPWVVNSIARGSISLRISHDTLLHGAAHSGAAYSGAAVYISDQARLQAQENGFIIP